MIQAQRSSYSVPAIVIWLLIISFTTQILWHHRLPPPEVQIQPLSSPPTLDQLRLVSLGDTLVSASILMLWLQSFDNQSGQFLSYRQLDYTALQQWLERILQLEPRSQYPLLVASHVYSNVSDLAKMRQMLEFVYQQFLLDPPHRWPWLAQATVLAKHRLKDLPLALKYAQIIATHATPEMPAWAKEMHIFILEDMGELEQARLVIGGMLASGQVTESNEVRFLNDKLQELEKKAGRNP